MASEVRPALGVLLASLAVCASACDGSASLSSAMGHYEGFMLRQSAGNPPTQMSISADASLMSKSPVEIGVKISTPSVEVDFDIKANGDGKTVELGSPSGFLPAPITLTQSQKGCYSDATGDSICFDGTELNVDLLTTSQGASVKLVMDRMDPSATPPLETPQTYSLEQLVQRAKAESFDTKVELESVIQANLTAKNAFLNLLPHLNINDGLNAATAAAVDPFSYLTMSRSIGDLIPFVLPDRWAGAYAAKDSAEAEFDSYRIMQASAMNIVQGLALSMLRDEHALDVLGENEVVIIRIRDLIKRAESQGGGDFPIGSSDQIDAVVDAIDLSIADLKLSLEEERTSLSQASGFMNPEAVSDVEEIAAPAVTGQIQGTLDDWRNTALARSLQLLQIDHLVESAQATKDGRYVQWLDPTGDDNGSIGPGMFSYVEIGSSQIRQLYDKRTQAQSTILKDVDDALNQSTAIYARYQIAVKSSANAEGQIDRFMASLQGGLSFALSDLVTALQNKAVNDVNQVNAEYAFLTLEAQLDYLTFGEDYAPLLTEKMPVSP